MSVGIARQYCGALGKVGNCQIGVSISAATPEASCPLDWRLFMPANWDEDPRRVACRVPEAVRHQPKWRLALEMIDELVGWGIEPAPVLGDAAYGDITELCLGLEARGINYVLDVKDATSALPESARPEQPARSSGRGRPPAPSSGPACRWPRQSPPPEPSWVCTRCAPCGFFGQAPERRKPRVSRAFVEWRMTGSNRRPLRCQRSALPAELIPRDGCGV